MTETMEPINGAQPPTPEQIQAALQNAVQGYAAALAQSKRLGNQIQVNPVEIMTQSALVSVQVGLLLDILFEMQAINPMAWQNALTERLNAITAQLNKPQIAIAVAGSMRRS